MVARGPNLARGALGQALVKEKYRPNIIYLSPNDPYYLGKSCTPFFPRFCSLNKMTPFWGENLHIKLKISARFARIFNTFLLFYVKVNQFWSIKAIFECQ